MNNAYSNQSISKGTPDVLVATSRDFFRKTNIFQKMRTYIKSYHSDNTCLIWKHCKYLKNWLQSSHPNMAISINQNLHTQKLRICSVPRKICKISHDVHNRQRGKINQAFSGINIQNQAWNSIFTWHLYIYIE